jgi:formylglycine-generating enzyme required for sulfatase activity
MHGNVWEWCLDSVANYPAGAVTDPFVTVGPYVVRRGGAWNEGIACRSAFRSYGTTVDANDAIGFRIVLGPIRVP